MATAQDFPVLFGESIGVLAHKGTGLRRKVRGGADEHHGLNAIRLLGGHVEQDIATTADADALAGANSDVIEQSKHVSGGLLVAEGLPQNARVTVTTQVGQNQLKSVSPLLERRNPILAGTGKAVQQQERLSRSMDLEVELLAVQHFNATGRTDKGHLRASYRKILRSTKKTALIRPWQQSSRRTTISGNNQLPEIGATE